MTTKLVEAALLPHLLPAALAYADLGFSVLACEGKKPAVNWTAFQSRAAHPDTIRKWDQVGLLQNVGIICGAVSGNLVVVDCDGWNAVQKFTSEFPELVDTYIVTSGSGRGQHFYYIVQNMPKTTKILGADGNIELRADGCYVVAPPSIHPISQQRYSILRPRPIMILSHMNHVVNWIKSLSIEQRAAPSERPARPVNGASRWALAALAAECRAVALAPNNSRNNTLNRAAFKLGQIVGAGMLARSDVERQLEAAASGLAKDDGLLSVQKTIKSGLDAGSQNPRRS